MKNLKTIALKHNLKSLVITIVVILVFWMQFKFNDFFTNFYNHKILYLLPIAIGTILISINIKWTKSHFRQEIPEVYYDHYLNPVTKGNSIIHEQLWKSLPRSKSPSKIRKKERCKFQGSMNEPKISYQISRVKVSLSRRKGTKISSLYKIDGDLIWAKTNLNFCSEPIMFVNEELVEYDDCKFNQAHALRFRVDEEVKGLLLYNNSSPQDVEQIKNLIKRNPLLFLQPKDTVCLFHTNKIMYLTTEYYHNYSHVPMFIFNGTFNNLTYDINSEIDRFNLFIDEIENF